MGVIDATPAGMHIGKLAGLDPLARKLTVDEYLGRGDKISYASADEVLKAQSVDHEPLYTMREIMGDWEEEMLAQVLADYGLAPQEGATRDDIMDMAVENIAKDLHDCLMALEYSGEAEFNSLMRALDAGGSFSFPEDEAQANYDLKVFSPYSFMFFKNGVYTFLIPDLYLANIKKLPLEEIRGFRRQMSQALTLCATMVELRGVVELGEAYATLRELYGDDCFSGPEFARVIQLAARTQGYSFACWSKGGVDYLLHFSMDDRFNQREGKDGEKGDDSRYMSMVEFRDMLLENHGKYPGRQVAQAMLDEGMHNWKLNQPAVEGFRAFLDENIPDEENDYLFADQVVDDILAFSLASFDLNRALAYLRDKGLEPLMARDNTLQRKLVAMMEGLPRWEFNGHTPADARQGAAYLRTLDADGKAHKVGRNDPCPCGSGKKYKNCCGKA